MINSADERFAAMLEKQGIQLNKKQLDQFSEYYNKLITWNKKVNLTKITDEGQVYLKHFYDSLTMAFYMNMDEIDTMADIGAGAGFPSIPVKIVFPHIHLTIIDSLRKRIDFLGELVNSLGLDNVSCIHGRAEEAGRNPELRDRYSLVCARAVARLHVLNELCLPFVKKGGRFVALKGSHSSEELIEAEASIMKLNGEYEHSYKFLLPIEEAERSIIVIRKKADTPAKYPRRPGKPVSDPIN